MIHGPFVSVVVMPCVSVFSIKHTSATGALLRNQRGVLDYVQI